MKQISNKEYEKYQQYQGDAGRHAVPDKVAGGPKMPHCSELWDVISRYIYTGLQGGSIMKGWMDRENEIIACCSDGTRPVIFKIERIDYE